jgi:polyisoprenoid-binding protein YceI
MKTGFLILATLSVPAFAAKYGLELKPEATKIQWTLADPLHTVHGTFHLKRGRIDFDSDTGGASGQVVVDVLSGNSGSEARDRRMHASVLQSPKYPEAVFTPDHVEGTLAPSGTSNIKVHGTLSLHGAPHELTMDVHATATADELRTAIEFDVPYVAWGMKDPSNFLLKCSKTVRVSIEGTGSLQRR